MVEPGIDAWLNENTARTRKARTALAQAGSKGDVLLPPIMPSDLGWVLDSR